MRNNVNIKAISESSGGSTSKPRYLMRNSQRTLAPSRDIGDYDLDYVPKREDAANLVENAREFVVEINEPFDDASRA